MFNLKTTSIYKSLQIEKAFFFGKRSFFRSLFSFCLIIFALLFFSGLFFNIFDKDTLKMLLGGIMFSLGMWVFFMEADCFFRSKIEKPELKYTIKEGIGNDFNVASFLSLEGAKLCKKVLKEKQGDYSSLLLFSILSSNNREVKFIFSRLELSEKDLKKTLKKESKIIADPEKELDKILSKAMQIAVERNKERIGISDILISLSESNPLFQKTLILADITPEDIRNLADWYERVEENIKKQKRFWTKENLAKKGSIAKDWTAGYSLTLDKYSYDLREIIRKSGTREVVGHRKEILETERILSKDQINNVLLVGEPGSGRESIVRAVAQKAFLGASSNKINYKRILNFNIAELASSIESPEKLEAVLDDCFQQVVKAGNIILVIKEIHNFVSSVAKPGTIDISGILSQYLPLPSFQIIAITSFQGLQSTIEKNSSFLNLFEKVEASEISEKETLRLLENILPYLEKKYKKFITYKALREILELSSRYLEDIPFPEKAIRLLDESMSWLERFGKQKVLLAKDVKKVVSEKTNIPLEILKGKEKEILLNLEKLIHRRIINQKQAVREIGSALRRARAQVRTKSGPNGSFLFLGPTGVGKTETAKALASIYFGSKKKMIRMDMSEFQSIKDVKRLIGDSGQSGLLTSAVKQNPFSLVLLDEIEKAHPNILNLFLQVLDEGWITDGLGRKINFSNTMIIATSNAGAELIREDISKDKKMDIIKEELIDYLLKEKIFRPEFINRFDSIVVFKTLTEQNLLDICQLMLNKLALNLKDKGIIFEITPELKQEIVKLSYSPEFGAREMQRTIQDKIENLLATALLSGRIKRGNKIKIKAENKKFEIKII